MQFFCDLLNRLFDVRPGGCLENENGNFPMCQVLLISKILICRYQNIISLAFGRFDKTSVCELGPAIFCGGIHRGGMQKTPKRKRDPLVKKDFHAATGSSRLAEAYSKTASTWPRPTPGNHSKNSSTEAPSSKFSNKARTGTLVPRKTQEPPTFLGLCSTLLHWSQKFIETQYRGRDHLQTKISGFNQRATRTPS